MFFSFFKRTRPVGYSRSVGLFRVYVDLGQRHGMHWASCVRRVGQSMFRLVWMHDARSSISQILEESAIVLLVTMLLVVWFREMRHSQWWMNSFPANSRSVTSVAYHGLPSSQTVPMHFFILPERFKLIL